MGWKGVAEVILQSGQEECLNGNQTISICSITCPGQMGQGPYLQTFNFVDYLCVTIEAE